MCGICGIYNYQSREPVDKWLVSEMASQMKHRGPDDDGFYFSDVIGLGMRRLSIIDLESGHQPIFNENQTILTVFNGEIYNYRELRHELELRGHDFYTQSDTEVIVHGYEEWGISVLNRLNGIFGLAIWDISKQQLLLARDRYGVKPVYYYDDGRRLLFGSELKTILCDPNVLREVDEKALDLYLTFRFVPSPMTLLKGIHKIPPGYFLKCDNNGSSLERYFNYLPNDNILSSEEELIEELRYLLKKLCVVRW